MPRVWLVVEERLGEPVWFAAAEWAGCTGMPVVCGLCGFSGYTPKAADQTPHFVEPALPLRCCSGDHDGAGGLVQPAGPQPLHAAG